MYSESLIRIAFQCLQLVVTDFLPVMPWRCLPLCVNTAAKFGSQTQELNISLTAVGLMVKQFETTTQNVDLLNDIHHHHSFIYFYFYFFFSNAVEHIRLFQSESR